MVRRLPGLLSVLILLVGLPAQAGPSPERCDRRSNLIEVEREKPVEEVALEHLNSDKTALEAMVNHKVVVDRFALMGWNRGEMGGTILIFWRRLDRLARIDRQRHFPTDRPENPRSIRL
jgi:hypothetical protein